MKKSTMVALGCGASAPGSFAPQNYGSWQSQRPALAVHFWKRKQTGEAVACGVVGGCAATVAAGCTVCSLRKRETLRLEERETPLLTKLGGSADGQGSFRHGNIDSSRLQAGQKVENAGYVGEMKKFVAGLIGGKRVYGTVSNAAIALLKKFENPPVDDDGKVGLHLPWDGTITYGYGIVVGRGDEISDELGQKYPPMSEEDATAQLRAAVAERARYVSNKLANRGLRATQQEFDAFVLDEYQSGDSSPLMERAQSLETLEELIQLFQRPSTIYPGLLKRREAEARVYFEGDYGENFSY